MKKNCRRRLVRKVIFLGEVNFYCAKTYAKIRIILLRLKILGSSNFEKLVFCCFFYQHHSSAGRISKNLLAETARTYGAQNLNRFVPLGSAGEGDEDSGAQIRSPLQRVHRIRCGPGQFVFDKFLTLRKKD